MVGDNGNPGPGPHQTATGSITIPDQNFTPAACHFYYETFAGYGYAFEWFNF